MTPVKANSMPLSLETRSILRCAHSFQKASRGEGLRAGTNPTASRRFQTTAIKLSLSFASPGSQAQSVLPELDFASARPPHWRKIGLWKETSEADFLQYRWQVSELFTLMKSDAS